MQARNGARATGFGAMQTSLEEQEKSNCASSSSSSSPLLSQNLVKIITKLSDQLSIADLPILWFPMLLGFISLFDFVLHQDFRIYA
ncbi:hypothetical protein KIN20_023653 [Parelaphostrongylus tenuis]|uniref:Uncharacterized protein n=1 Tax=Parelaphostrongylus tenuis TaxID=148309 RepID=A0AAD5MVX8_PARTN|nr:hypothetical protein KIN20_023653 [Parelaphostrongylus tenuis]